MGYRPADPCDSSSLGRCYVVCGVWGGSFRVGFSGGKQCLAKRRAIDTCPPNPPPKGGRPCVPVSSRSRQGGQQQLGSTQLVPHPLAREAHSEAGRRGRRAGRGLLGLAWLAVLGVGGSSSLRGCSGRTKEGAARAGGRLRLPGRLLGHYVGWTQWIAPCVAAVRGVDAWVWRKDASTETDDSLFWGYYYALLLSKRSVRASGPGPKAEKACRRRRSRVSRPYACSPHKAVNRSTESSINQKSSPSHAKALPFCTPPAQLEDSIARLRFATWAVFFSPPGVARASLVAKPNVFLERSNYCHAACRHQKRMHRSTQQASLQ